MFYVVKLKNEKFLGEHEQIGIFPVASIDDAKVYTKDLLKSTLKYIYKENKLLTENGEREIEAILSFGLKGEITDVEGFYRE